ncbi:substrate-binding domain-containing protein [Halovulum sp. GXIMD14793]
MQAGLKGEVAGLINFWHFLAKMKTKGFSELVSVSDAARALGLDPTTPLLGYVVTGDMLREKPELVAGLAKASREAKAILASDDAAWDRLRERIRVSNDAEFEALKAGFRAGIPAETPVNVAAAVKMFDLMVKLGGEKLMGSAKTFPDGVFYKGE